MKPFLEIETVDGSQGLPSDQVHAIAQDATGRLWSVGPAGVSRYDGSRVTVFDVRSGLRCQGLRTLKVAGDLVWIGADRGLEVIQTNGRGTKLLLEHEWQDALVESIAIAETTIWIGCARGLLRLGLDQKAQRLRVVMQAEIGFVRDIVPLGGGTILAAASKGGLIRCTGWAWERIANFAGDAAVSCLHRTSDGRTIAATSDTLFVLDEAGSTIAEVALPSGTATVTAVTTAGPEWWVGAGNEVLLLEENGARVEFVGKYPVGSRINSIFVDRENNVWLAANTGGMKKISCLRRDVARIFPGGAHGAVYSIKEVAADRLRITGETFCATIAKSSTGEATAGEKLEQLPPVVVWDSVQDPLDDSAYWLATQEGLLVVRAGQVQWFGKEDPVLESSTRSLLWRGRDLFVGTLNGLSRIREGKAEEVRAPDGTGLGYVYCLSLDDAGRLWIGTLGRGMWCETENELRPVVGEHLSATGHTYAITPNEAGRVLVAQDERIILLEANGASRVVLEEYPLAGWAVAWIDAERAVIGSNDGLLVLDLMTNSLTKRVTSLFGKEKWQFTNNRALWVDSAERIYCGLSTGLHLVNLPALAAFSQPPELHVAEIHWQNCQPVEKDGSAHLPPGKWSMKASVYSAWFVAEEQVRFRFQLVGFDPDWSELGSESEVKYNSLPPGRYELRGQAFTPLTGFGPVKTLLRLEVAAPRWALGMTRLLDGLTAVADRQLWALPRNRRLIERNRELEREAEERRAAEAMWRESEARYRALVGASAQIVWNTDPDGKVVEDSPSWRAFTGQTYDQFKEFGWLNVIHPDDRQHVNRHWRRTVAEQGVLSIEHRVRHVSGEWRWNSVHAVPLRDANGAVKRWVGMNADVTERKTSEMVIECQTAVLRQIVNGAPLAQTLTTLLAKMDGFEPGMISSILLLDRDGQRLRHGAAPSLPEAYTKAIDGAAIGPAVGSCGTAAFRKETVIVEDIENDPLWKDYRDLALPHDLRACWSTPIFDDQRHVLGTFAVYYRKPGPPNPRHLESVALATDLAAIAISRDRDEKALRIGESRHRRLLESKIVGVIITNTDGRICEANDYFLEMVGYSRDDLIAGRVRWDTMTPPDGRPLVEHILQQLGNFGVCGPVEKEYIRKDGTRLPFLGSAALLEGSPGYCICLVQDLTNRKSAEQKLSERSFLLSESQRIAHVGTWSLEADGMELRWSDETYRIFQLDPGSYVPTLQGFLGLIHQTDRDEAGEWVALCRSGQRPEDLEFRIQLPNENERILRASAELLPGTKTTPARLVGTVHDVTERRRAEEAVRASEIRFRTIFEQAPLGIAEGEIATSRMINVNQRYADIVGYTREELHRMTFAEYTHPEDLEKDLEQLDRLAAGEINAYEIEKRFLRKDGGVIWVNLTVTGLARSGERPRHSIAVLDDITARKEAESQLREAHERFHVLIESAPLAILSVDGSGRILNWNAGAKRLFGWTEAEALGKLAPAVPPEGVEDHLALIRRVMRGETVGGRVRACRKKDGTSIQASVNAAALRDASGEITGVIVMLEDVTERRLAKRKLEESREELRALLARLQRAREEERIHVSREIHDELGQLLTALKMDVRWLERKLSDPGLPASFNLLLDRAVAISELSDAMTAAVQKVASELRPVTLDTLGLPSALSHEARRFQERSGIRCVVTGESTLELSPEVAGELFYICQEALTNVARHARATEVEIRLGKKSPGIQLEVLDNGIGMGEMKNERRTLGLIGMRERAAQCGGTVTLQANHPNGTRVAVRIPTNGATEKGSIHDASLVGG